MHSLDTMIQFINHNNTRFSWNSIISLGSAEIQDYFLLFLAESDSNKDVAIVASCLSIVIAVQSAALVYLIVRQRNLCQACGM